MLILKYKNSKTLYRNNRIFFSLSLCNESRSGLNLCKEESHGSHNCCVLMWLNFTSCYDSLIVIYKIALQIKEINPTQNK